MKYWGIFFLFGFCVCAKTHAQINPLKDSIDSKWESLYKTDGSTDSITIKKITVQGNKRTKPQIILRELAFHKGDAIAIKDISAELKLSKQQLMNMSLFVDVELIPIQTGNTLEIQVNVKERWYLFPLLYFKLVDRNFNQWWVEQHRSLDRVNYGIKFIQNNITGRNDNLDVWLITGYTKQITLRYDLPFADRKLKSGFNIGFIYAGQKELNYATGDNKQLFYKKDDAFVRTQTRFDFTYSYRPDIRQRHTFRISYNKEHIADTVLKINPNYFTNQGTNFEYIDFNYGFRYYHADNNAYPKDGFLFQGNIYKRGLDHETNLWMANARAVYAFPIAKKSFLHFEAMAQVKSPPSNGYIDQKMFGYGSFQMRGLEYNVVDGMTGIMLKSSIHREMLHFEVKNPFKSKTHDRIPFRIYLKAYTDLGYAKLPNAAASNTLNNTLLHTYGFGMDIVSIYDFVFKIEYSFNQLGKQGLYLQSRNDF
jgi:outer membrane protein assembly factor BamA